MIDLDERRWALRCCVLSNQLIEIFLLLFLTPTRLVNQREYNKSVITQRANIDWLIGWHTQYKPGPSCKKKR
jgi:hypothetical protein